MKNTKLATIPNRIGQYVNINSIGRGYSKTHEDRVRKELKAAGAVLYDMLLPETKALPFVIHENEHIKGVVYGRYEDGTGSLVATDRRVIFIDKKFLFVKIDEITFDVISAVTEAYIGPTGTITLHTRLGDYKLHTLNIKSGHIFSNYIETTIIDKKED